MGFGSSDRGVNGCSSGLTERPDGSSFHQAAQLLNSGLPTFHSGAFWLRE
jgi:hypothetical protein